MTEQVEAHGVGKDSGRLEVDHVVQRFSARGVAGGQVVAVDDVSFALTSQPPSIVSLVGQSGSGKSTLARLILGLDRPSAGQVRWRGKDIHRLNRRENDDFRRGVQPVFQDPYAIFNPFYKVDRVMHMAVGKFGLTKSRAAENVMIEESLTAVRLDPGRVLGRYPHQLSGGQRQRVMLARIHLLRPSFVIADEPTSMLDAQVRKGFLDILRDFHQTLGMTTLFITHDLSTVHYLGGEIMVITKGRIVERGAVAKVMSDPQHPYTAMLLASVPRPDPDQRWTDRIDVSQVTG